MGEGWHSASQLQVPLKPKGPLLNRRWWWWLAGIGSSHCWTQHHCLQCIVIGRVQWECDEGHIETHWTHHHHHHSPLSRMHWIVESSKGTRQHLLGHRWHSSDGKQHFSKHCPQAMQDLTWEAGERQDIAWAPWKDQSIALDILQRRGENLTMLMGTDLTALLTWQ